MTQQNRLLICLYLLVFVVLSFFLFRCFSPNELDSFWIYSWATQLVDHNTRADVFFRPDDKAAGTYLFHLIPTAIIGCVYKIVGHGYPVIMIANCIWMALMLASMNFFLRLEGLASKKTIFLSCLLIGLMEPVLRGVVSLRPEIISIVITYIGLGLLRLNHRVLPGLLSILAIEAHITGIVGFLFIIVRLVEEYPSKENLITAFPRFFIGALLGGFIYLALHQNVITFEWIADLLRRRNIDAGHSPFFNYFWMAKYKRHLPEIAFMTIAGLVVFRISRQSFLTQRHKSLIVQAMIGLFVTEALGRGNYLYVVWWMVPFYLLCLSIKPRGLWPLLAFHLMSYVLVFGYNVGYSHAGLAHTVSHHATSADYVLGPNAVFPGTARPSQFGHLAPGANINPKYRLPDHKILIVSKDIHPGVTVVETYGGYRIGWYLPISTD